MAYFRVTKGTKSSAVSLTGSLLKSRDTHNVRKPECYNECPKLLSTKFLYSELEMFIPSRNSIVLVTIIILCIYDLSYLHSNSITRKLAFQYLGKKHN